MKMYHQELDQMLSNNEVSKGVEIQSKIRVIAPPSTDIKEHFIRGTEQSEMTLVDLRSPESRLAQFCDQTINQSNFLHHKKPSLLET